LAAGRILRKRAAIQTGSLEVRRFKSGKGHSTGRATQGMDDLSRSGQDTACNLDSARAGPHRARKRTGRQNYDGKKDEQRFQS
jgi:hypothetical protein